MGFPVPARPPPCHDGPGDRVMLPAALSPESSACSGRLVRTGVAVLVLLISGTVAEGSCGDWLAGHQRGERQGQSLHLDPPHDDSGRRDSSDPLTVIAGGRSRPPAGIPRCHGPSCRGVPAAPSVPRDAAGDVPPHDQADRCCPVVPDGSGVAGALFVHVHHGTPKGVRAVPIRPPRRASLQA